MVLKNEMARTFTIKSLGTEGLVYHPWSIATIVVDDVHVVTQGESAALILNYRKTSNISRTLVGNKIVDDSDVVGASPVGAAPTTSSFST